MFKIIENKDAMVFLTILTPTYNRANTLKKCYECLKEQTNKNFEWLIIDDGSKDNTEELVTNWMNSNKFTIKYLYKDNGGKHTALNIGLKHANSEATIILDSDDILVRDAVETIFKEWDLLKNKNLSGICFLKGYTEDAVIGHEFPENYFIDNYINVKNFMKVKGDKAEVWRTEVLQQYSWPNFNNEKFMAIGYVWNLISLHYNMIFINKIIYIAEYLEGGLTKSGKKIRVKSPLGGMENSKVYFSDKFPVDIKIKKMILYICYGFFAKKTIPFMINDCKTEKLFIFCLPAGYLLYKYWEFKHLK